MGGEILIMSLNQENLKEEVTERRDDESGPDYLLASERPSPSPSYAGRDLWPSFAELLARAGLTQGMRVADIGCGTGLVSLWIATPLGAEGSATGIDMSGEQLRMAEKNAVAAGLTNVSFHQASAYDTNLPRTQFDLVYSRFLMCHLTTESMWIPAESAAFLISSAFAASGSVDTCTTSNPTSRASWKRSP